VTTWQAAQVIAIEAYRASIYLWQVTAALITVAMAALLLPSLKKVPVRRRLIPLLLSYVMPVAIIGIGAVLAYDGPRGGTYVEPPLWRGVVLWGALLAHVGILIGAVVLMRGARVRAAAVVLPGVWASLCTGVVSAFAIAGVGP
jgi:hypothetical protein